MLMSRLFPELNRFPTRKVRRDALKRAIRGVSQCGWYWLAVAGVVAVSVYVQFSLRRFGLSPDGRTAMRWGVVAVTIGTCSGLSLSFRSTIQRALRRSLVAHGIPCCTSCGYDVTGNTSGVCPECGVAISEREGEVG